MFYQSQVAVISDLTLIRQCSIENSTTHFSKLNIQLLDTRIHINLANYEFNVIKSGVLRATATAAAAAAPFCCQNASSAKFEIHNASVYCRMRFT